MLVDIVSKGGNLLLSIPIRGDGSIDEKEEAICNAIADWMEINGQAIHGTDVWKVCGEGPQVNAPHLPLTGQFNEGKGPAPTEKDIRYTKKGNVVYAFVLDVPKEPVVLESFADEKVKSVSLLGVKKPVKWRKEDGRLILSAPEKDSGLKSAVCYKITLSK